MRSCEFSMYIREGNMIALGGTMRLRFFFFVVLSYALVPALKMILVDYTDRNRNPMCACVFFPARGAY